MDRIAFTPPEGQFAKCDACSGKMYWFDHNAIKVFSPDGPRCWIKTEKSNGWKAHRPFDLTNPFQRSDVYWEKKDALKRNPGKYYRYYRRKQWATLQWLQAFPRETRDAVRPLNDECLWGGLSFLSRFPAGPELFAQNPAWCLLAYHGFLCFPMEKRPTDWLRQLRALVQKPKPQLLDRLNLPASPATVRVLARTQLPDLQLMDIVGLLRAVSDQSPYRKFFLHLPAIHAPIVRLVHQHDPLQGGRIFRLTPGLLHSLRERATQQRALNLFAELTETAEYLKRPGVDPFLPRSGQRDLARSHCVHSMEALETWTEHLRELHHRFFNAWVEADREIGLLGDEVRVAAPPFRAARVATAKGPVRIEPLLTAGHLRLHAREQRNCLAGRVGNAIQGFESYYQIHCPFTAAHTLSLVHRNGACVSFHCLQERNRQADPEVIAAVTSWLAAPEPFAESDWERALHFDPAQLELPAFAEPFFLPSAGWPPHHVGVDAEDLVREEGNDHDDFPF